MEINKTTVTDFILDQYQKGIDPSQKDALNYFCVSKDVLEKRLRNLGTSFIKIKNENWSFFNTQPFINSIHDFFRSTSVDRYDVENCALYLNMTYRQLMERLNRFNLKFKEIKKQYCEENKIYRNRKLTELELYVICLHFGIYCIDTDGYTLSEVATMLGIHKNKVVVLLRSGIKKIKDSQGIEILQGYC